MLVELHCHSNLSKREIVVVEGLNTPKEILEHARRVGLGAVAITDHDVITGSLQAKKLEKKQGVVVITGQEVTTKSGHVLALGISEFIRPRMTVEETVDVIHDQDGIAIAPHPFDLYKEGIKEKAILCDAIEGFNSLNLDRISNRKSYRFGKIHKMIILAGSDAHCIEMMNHGVISVKAHDMDSILRGIKKGRAVIEKADYHSAKVIKDWSARRLKLSYDEVLNYINENYSWPKRVVSRNLLGLVNMYPGKIDYFFRAITYASLGATMLYSASREATSRIVENIY